MRILAIIRYKPTVTREDVSDLILPEERTAWRQYLDGFVREIYVAGDESATDARTIVVALLEADDIPGARDRMDEFPMIYEGFVEVEYIELEPFVYWEQLFREAERSRDD